MITGGIETEWMMAGYSADEVALEARMSVLFFSKPHANTNYLTNQRRHRDRDIHRRRDRSIDRREDDFHRSVRRDRSRDRRDRYVERERSPDRRRRRSRDRDYRDRRDDSYDRARRRREDSTDSWSRSRGDGNLGKTPGRLESVKAAEVSSHSTFHN
jgi:ATP-dependent RNA helicase DDX46/PRP5